MSIVPVRKVTLCGTRADRQGLLEGLQRLGCMHLVSLRPPPKEPEKAPPERAEDAYRALRYLLDLRNKRRQVIDTEGFDFDRVVIQALANQQRRRDVEDRRDFLAHRIEGLTPWGHFELPGESLAGHRLWFYQLPHNQMAAVHALDLPWQVVHKDNRFAYIAVIALDEPPRNALPVARTHTGAVPLNELKRQLRRAEIELEDIDAEHQALSRWIFLMGQNLARAEDEAALTHASAQLLEADGLCAVQGWLPERDLPRLQAFADKVGLALLAEAPGPEETPPTLLENPEPVSGGQDLVGFYQTPSYRSWDPSPIVFFSFALFFAMILADAGYALVLSTLVARLLEAHGRQRDGQALAPAIGGGAGCLAALRDHGRQLFRLHASRGLSDRRAEGAGAEGLRRHDAAVHRHRLSALIMANAAVAYRAGGFPRNAPPLGWIGAILGGMLFWLGATEAGPAVFEQAGIVLVVLGLGLVLFFSGRRKIDSIKSFFMRLLEGLMSLTNATKMFGDVLSYLRLFALGLASSSLAVTFNQLAVDVRDGLPGIGVLLGILVLLLGHTINLALGIVSGFVHGLRLNFIEFFSWGVPEEGYPFRAFAKKEIEHE